jgi:hypothetical protein
MVLLRDVTKKNILTFKPDTSRLGTTFEKYYSQNPYEHGKCSL